MKQRQKYRKFVDGRKKKRRRQCQVKFYDLQLKYTAAHIQKERCDLPSGRRS